jgi:hypothetical protein
MARYFKYKTPEELAADAAGLGLPISWRRCFSPFRSGLTVRETGWSCNRWKGATGRSMETPMC